VKTKHLLLAARLIGAIIMLQTLYFKFTAHPEAVHIFSTIGMEPYGRIGVGVGELIASILVLVPSTVWLGALMGIGLMSGAIFFHLTTPLGIQVVFTGKDGVVVNDHGQLFAYALIVMLCSCYLAWNNRTTIFSFINSILKKK